jgi:hypothetical protein
LYLIFEALLYCTLISSFGVFEPKQHGHVAISAEGCNKGCLDLVVLVESDLVITRVTVEKR